MGINNSCSVQSMDPPIITASDSLNYSGELIVPQHHVITVTCKTPPGFAHDADTRLTCHNLQGVTSSLTSSCSGQTSCSVTGEVTHASPVNCSCQLTKLNGCYVSQGEVVVKATGKSCSCLLQLYYLDTC